MNILSLDIEEWSVEKDHFGDRKTKYVEFDRILDIILETLDNSGVKATFFCLGKIAIDFPHVIKKIEQNGHEIGSHSHAHKWINKMSPEEFREDTHVALCSLEDLIGKKVRSFRAPAFSIGESNKWAIEILAEAGIENDASIFPGARDFGGFPNFNMQKPCVITHNGARLNEFPIPLYLLPLVGKKIAYSGGGYFRLLPLSFIKSRMANSDYNMCYFHIADLLTEKSPFMSRAEFETYFKEAGPLYRRLLRYIKSNIGHKTALPNMQELLKTFSFTSIEDFLDKNKMDNMVEL
jgi:polysaccharide deacetylase family protein (PEP-CTERM system associated)